MEAVTFCWYKDTVLTHWKIEALVKYGWVFVLHTQIIGYHKWHKF